MRYLDKELVMYLILLLIALLKILMLTTAPNQLVLIIVDTLEMLVFSVMLIVLKAVSDYSKGAM